jgi:hypothetical protein
MKHALLLSAFAVTGLLLNAQQTAIPVAVFPFVPAIPEYTARARQIQGMVMETFRSNTHVQLIDRLNDTLILIELRKQMRAESVVAQGLVDQGRLSGAKAMIVGEVTNVSVEEKHAPVGIGLGKSATDTKLYTASVSFTLQLSDVETGVVKGNKSFSNRDGKRFLGQSLHVELSASPEAAILKAVNTCQRSILSWLDDALSPGIRIVAVDQRDPGGFPKTLLISGIGTSGRHGASLIINEISYLDNGSGQKLERKQKLVDMRIEDRQGDITVCRITNGERVIEERMKAGARLECVMNR